MEPKLSSKFTVEDIRALRDYNSQRHLKMSTEEIIAERKKSTEWFLNAMSEIKKQKSTAV